MRAWLEQVEGAVEPGTDEALVAAAFIASRTVPLDAEELGAARRRALFVLAAGGDPHRRLDLDSRAVETLARDLDSEERRAALGEALNRMRADAADLPGVAAAVDRLAADPDLSWRALACALLADEVSD